jgi:DNA-binding response OmpR family regulator
VGQYVRAPEAIVIADRDASLRALVSSALTDAGYETFEAATGEEALEVTHREHPALVILEVRLPDLSGYEVCHRLKAEFGARLPILFISSLRRSSDRVAGLLIGADDDLSKPFVPDELLARVRALLRRSRAMRRAGSVLTRREEEVLHLLTEGLDQNEIGRRLAISPRTVGTHIEHLLHKLDVHSRAQAVAIAYREGLLGNGGAPVT